METMPDLFTTANAALVGVTIAVISGLRTVAPWLFEGGHWRERLLPMLPIPVAVVACFLGMGDVAGDWMLKVKTGVLAGLAAGHAWKMINTTVRGKGIVAKEAATSPESNEGV